MAQTGPYRKGVRKTKQAEQNSRYKTRRKYKMICVHCGKEIDNGQAFCPYCGSRVGGDAAPEAKAAKKDPRKLALPSAAFLPAVWSHSE